MYIVLLFYKYVDINDTFALCDAQKKLCKELGLKGRTIIAHEGINATLEGTDEVIEQYCKELVQDKRFADVQFKKSIGTGNAFPKLSVKVRDEIVSGHLGEIDVNPQKVTGKYLTAEELHAWIKEKRELYIVDMRNDYEQKSGYFTGSILPEMGNFRDLPKVLPKLAHLKNKTIVTVCTGGVRCEKASGFLVQNGFRDVYQLYGGIVTYMEKYPNEDFKGKLYVFDNRLVIGFNTDDPKHETVGKCENCGKPSENYINCLNNSCHRHFIACSDCVNENNQMYCPMGCLDFGASDVAIGA